MMSAPNSDPGVSLRRYRWRAAAWTAAATLTGVVVFVLFIRNVLGWDFEVAALSPLASDVGFGPRYQGWLGSFGVVGWALTTAIAGLGATILWRRGERREGWFLAASGLLSAALLFDDLFMVHSTVAPRLLGVPKPVVIIVLVAVAVTWALLFRRRLLAEPDLPILLWAALWYAVALFIDAFGSMIGWGGVREETAKLIGVASWLVLFWRVTLRSIERDGVDV